MPVLDFLGFRGPSDCRFHSGHVCWHLLLSLAHPLISSANRVKSMTARPTVSIATARFLDQEHPSETVLPSSIAGLLSPECTITTSTFSARLSGSDTDRRPKNAGAPQFGLLSLNVSGCVLLKAAAMQALCDAFPSLHTCPQQRSLNVSGCLALTNVRCKCRQKVL